MNKVTNQEVQTFLEATQIMSPDKYESMIEIREIFHQHHPAAEEKIMYGGLTFFLNNELFGGIFINKNHISIEFSNGHLMNDPNKYLEGKGKYRRHLKIHQRVDIETKEVSNYIKQAISNSI